MRYASCEVVYNSVNALTHLNNTYFKRGLKRYLEEIATYRYVPDDFENIYMAVIDAKTIIEIRSASYRFLESVNDLYNKMYKDFVIQPIPTYDNLGGTFEELWCNCRNKVIASVELNDKSYAYYAAMGIQNFLDEMTESRGTKSLILCSILIQIICIYLKSSSCRSWMNIWKNIIRWEGKLKDTILLRNCITNT